MSSEKPSEVQSQLSPSRRTFLTGAGATALAGLAAACASDDTPTAEPLPQPTASGTTSEPVANTATAQAANETTEPATPVPFRGAHQNAVLVEPGRAGLVATFDVVATSRGELADTMRLLSNEVERLMAGQPLEQADEFLPPVDSGAVGAESGLGGIAITIAVGASLFDERFGLADRRPSELIPMPRFFNDRLVREELSHGDLSITINAPNQQAGVFALHQLVRATDRSLRLRWVQEGYNEILPEEPGQLAHTRNLMGFRDGTSNLDASNPETMRDFVWVQADDNEPEWAVGGSYQAVRVIRMLIEFWATAALVRQEQIFGRHRSTGAPLGQTNEGDIPSFAADPSDETIPRRAHIRLANPRSANSGRIMRQGFSYLNGADIATGTLDQGLLFLCYQRSLSRGFLEVQSRLDGEPLEDYIKPVGGGLFFALPGPGTEPGGWIGQSLLS